MSPDRLNDCTVKKDQSILDALHVMDVTAHKEIAVLDGNKVIGILTDGDVRRALLTGCTVDDGIEKAMTADFVSISEGDDISTVLNTFRDNDVSAVPVIREDGSLLCMITKRAFHTGAFSRGLSSYLLPHLPADTEEQGFDIVYKPWGYYRTMILNDTLQLKIICVLPKQALSLQSHQWRDEHWTIVSGNGIAQTDDLVRSVSPGDIVHIPRKCKHRMTNDSKDDVLIFSEVQLGDYFGEDDIQRYEDMYGRC